MNTLRRLLTIAARPGAAATAAAQERRRSANLKAMVDAALWATSSPPAQRGRSVGDKATATCWHKKNGASSIIRHGRRCDVSPHGRQEKRRRQGPASIVKDGTPGFVQEMFASAKKPEAAGVRRSTTPDQEESRPVSCASTRGRVVVPLTAPRLNRETSSTGSSIGRDRSPWHRPSPFSSRACSRPRACTTQASARW